MVVIKTKCRWCVENIRRESVVKILRKGEFIVGFWKTAALIGGGIILGPIALAAAGGAIAGAGAVTGIGALGTFGTTAAGFGATAASSIGLGGTAATAAGLGYSAGTAVTGAVSAKVAEELKKPSTYAHLTHILKHAV